MAVPLDLRIQHIRADKGTESTSCAFQVFCNDSGIALEFAATATPQQVGVPERDGRTIANIVRFLLKDGNIPPNLWGEMFFAAVYNSNRSLHAALHGATSYFKMHGN